MTDTETFEVPEVAKIPLPEKPAPEPQPVDDKREAMIKAAVLYDQFEQQRQQLEVMLTEATLGIEARNRTIETLKLQLMEATNNLCAVQSTCEALRQENSELRALQVEQHALAKHLVARYENYEIPLPIRRKVKNGKQIAA
jgi:DNA repair exonuclease SbcCD ATPase subunit